MINLFDLLKTLQATVNPHQAGHIRPQENFTRWVNEIQDQIFEELARKMFINRTISDKLTPFLRSVNVTLQSQPGQLYDTFLRPQDYRYFSSARFIKPAEGVVDGHGVGCAGKPRLVGQTGQVLYEDPDDAKIAQVEEGMGNEEIEVKYIDNSRWSSLFRHVTKKPSRKNIYLTAIDEACRVAPRNLGVIVLDYLRPPKRAVFAYTVGSDDQIIFDANNSVNLEWDSVMTPDFIARLQAKYGVYVKEDFTYQAGQLQRAQAKA